MIEPGTPLSDACGGNLQNFGSNGPGTMVPLLNAMGMEATAGQPDVAKPNPNDGISGLVVSSPRNNGFKLG